MNSCQTCGCSPCQCAGSGAPAVLSNTQLINPLLTGATLDGGTINGAALNSPNIVGAQIDCTSRGCTAGTGVCNDGIATNAKVCNDIALAISGSNAAFCGAVADCISGNPTILCPTVAACINSTPGIINNTSAFGFNARATTGLFGVVRYATGLELQNGSCLLAIDPCTLIAAWNTPAIGTPFWNSFVSAVSTVLGDPAACAALAPCGFAPLASPTFTGVPAGPTAAQGTATTQLATTAFVATGIAAAISPANPAFCAAVTACGGGGGGGGGGGTSNCGNAIARGGFTTIGGVPVTVTYQQGCTITDFGAGIAAVTFTTPRSNANYTVTIGTSGGQVAQPLETPNAQWGNKSASGFVIAPINASGVFPLSVDFLVTETVDDGTCGSSGPGNFAAVRAFGSFNGVTGADSVGRLSPTSVVALYGCSAVIGPNGIDVVFSTAQPDTNYSISVVASDINPALGVIGSGFLYPRDLSLNSMVATAASATGLQPGVFDPMALLPGNNGGVIIVFTR